ncbi:unnamed protein product, partial [Iphiclides podalirius]
MKRYIGTSVNINGFLKYKTLSCTSSLTVASFFRFQLTNNAKCPLSSVFVIRARTTVRIEFKTSVNVYVTKMIPCFI